jgi:hypothetical protein
MGHQKVKMQQWKEREKNSSDCCLAERRVHFFGKKYCEKMYGKEQYWKERRKRVNCKK